MKQIAYIIGAGTLISTLVLACSDSSSGGTGTFAGEGGTSSGGTTSQAGANTGGKNTGGKNTAGTGTSGTGTTGGAGGNPDNFGGGGTEQGGGEQGGGEQGGSGGGGNPDACDTCLGTQCGTESETCDKNAECQAIFQCIADCKDDIQTCITTCEGSHANGKADFEAFQKCGVSKCQTDCSSGGGGDIKCTDVKVSDKDACNTCVQGKCCMELEGCANNPDCVKLNNCLATNKCQDQACANMCAQANPNGVATFNTFGMCFQGSCMTECQ